MSKKDKIIDCCEKLALSIRSDVLYMTSEHKAGFIGSSFSCADILAVLYGGIINIDINDPDGNESDVFILSKGHDHCWMWICWRDHCASCCV